MISCKSWIAPVLATAALFGAPTAAADINISGINIGNQGNAEASFGNVAVALGPLDQARAVGGVGNVAFASGGSVASKQGPGSLNLVTAAGNSNSSVVNGSFNVSSSLNRGSSSVNNSNLTINAAFGENNVKPSTASSVGVNGSAQVAFCGGTSTSANGRINVSLGSPCRDD